MPANPPAPLAPDVRLLRDVCPPPLPDACVPAAAEVEVTLGWSSSAEPLDVAAPPDSRSASACGSGCCPVSSGAGAVAVGSAVERSLLLLLLLVIAMMQSPPGWLNATYVCDTMCASERSILSDCHRSASSPSRPKECRASCTGPLLPSDVSCRYCRRVLPHQAIPDLLFYLSQSSPPHSSTFLATTILVAALLYSTTRLHIDLSHKPLILTPP